MASEPRKVALPLQKPGCPHEAQRKMLKEMGMGQKRAMGGCLRIKSVGYPEKVEGHPKSVIQTRATLREEAQSSA